MSVFDFLKKGETSRIAFVAHICGMPYAMCTDQECIDALESDTARRRTMFGANSIGASGIYPADTLPIFDVLQPPTTDKVRLHDGRGILQGGTWEIRVADEPVEHDWSGNPTHWTGDVWGLPGITTIPDGRIDESIGWGYLSRDLLWSYNGVGTQNVWIDHDEGDRIQDMISGLSGDEYLLLWIGGECVAVEGSSSSSPPEVMLDIVTDGRGVFHSKRQTFYADDQDSNIIVATAPIGGVVNRPVNLWALAMTAGGTITGDPVLVREGRITQSVSSKGGITTLKCSPWWSWLDTTVRTHHLAATLKGYAFNRTQDKSLLLHYLGDTQHPHLRIREYDGAAGTWGVKDIWLVADPGDATTSGVYYEDLESLRAAVQAELNRASTYNGESNTSTTGSDDLVHNYSIGEDGLFFCESREMVTGQDSVWQTRFHCTGPVAWVLALGAIPDEYRDAVEQDLRENWPTWDIDSYTNSDAFYNSGTPKNPTAWRLMLHKKDGETSYDDIEGATHYGALEQARYFYQWRRHGYTIGEYGASERNDWPVTTDGKLYLSDDVDATDFSTSLPVEVGSSSRNLNGKPTHSTGSIGSTADNYLTLDTSTAFQDVYGSESLPALAHPPGVEGPFRDLCSLYYIPFWHDSIAGGDPWPVGQKLYLRKQWLHKIFRALLGARDGSYYTIPERYQMNHIPGGASDGFSDATEVVDWNDFAEKVADVDFDVRFYLGFESDEKLNLLDLFRNCLLFFGLMPTWEYDEAKAKFVMRFRRMGIANATTALLEGRLLNNTNIAADTRPQTVHCGTWLFNRVACKCNYHVSTRQYEGEINVTSDTGWAIMGGRDTELKIDARMIWIKGIEQIDQDAELREMISRHFAQRILQNLIYPMPELTFQCGISTALTHGVGQDVLITDSASRNPYTGAIGLTSQPGVIVARSIDWSKGTVELTVRISPKAVYGWAPAVRIPANSSSVAGTVVTVTDADAHTFTPTTDRSDLSFFDCLDWSKADKSYSARSCSCGNYAVLAFEEGNADPSILSFTISDVNIDDDTPAYSCKLNGADAASWNNTKAYIIVFADWDDADLQDCQRYYLYASDEDNELVDDGANVTPGRRWT